jgi:pyruvate ferredoxin oxidoreductase beta subunit
MYVPCPLGWGHASDITIELSRLVVDCALFPLFEAEHGVVTSSTPIRKKVPVEEYLRPQRRFAHLFKKGAIDTTRIAKIQKMADENIKRFDLLRKEEENTF